MQQHRMKHEEVEEIDELKGQLGRVERERDRALEELREIKKRLNTSINAPNGVKDEELYNVRESLLNANKELHHKDKIIESLRSEVSRMKQLELKLKEKDVSIETMKYELGNLKASMDLTEGLLSDTKKRVVDLEIEVGIRNEAEAKLLDSFATQGNELEEVYVLLKKSNLENAALKETMRELTEEFRQKDEASKGVIDRLGNELQMEREKAKNTNNFENSPYADTQNLFEDIEVLKNELKLAMEAEDNSKKAMDDFAIVLKEVTSGSNHTKEKLQATEQQLEVVTEEAANLKKMVMNIEQTYESLVNELKMERDRLRNTVKRLRLEAEESLIAWNDKEVEFVNCIKKAEEEKIALVEENKRLTGSIREAEEKSDRLRDDIKKLRDILKQAVNEANVAKEAANLARGENAYLQDFLAEKDKALVSLAQENEFLRINEAEANENMKEMKRLMKLGSKREILGKSDRESKEQRKMSRKNSATDDGNDKEPREGRKLSNTFNFDINQLWTATPKSSKEFEQEPKKNDDDLGGSIFDIFKTPIKEEVVVKCHRRTSSACTDDGKSLNLGSFDDAENSDDLDMERSPQGKRKALIRRFGDLLRKKKFSASQGSIAKDLQQSHKEITV